MRKPDPKFLEAPEFWTSDWDDVNAALDNLATGEVREIGRSQGGRVIRAAAYGTKEPIVRRTSRFSAQLARHMDGFFDPARRSRPVLWSTSYLLRWPFGISIVTSNCTPYS